jgi:hypothetical protein
MKNVAILVLLLFGAVFAGRAAQRRRARMHRVTLRRRDAAGRYWLR